MSTDYESPYTPSDDDNRLDADTPDKALANDDGSYESLNTIAHSTVLRLGRLGVPAAVLADAKRREDNLQAIGTILQVSIDQEDLDEHEELSPEEIREIVYGRAHDPSLQLSIHPDFGKKMVSPPIDKSKPLAGVENFWTAVRTFEPYEHSAVRKVQLAISLEPYTGASTATMIISFRPSTFSSINGLIRLADLKFVLEHANPTNSDDDLPEKTYTLDGQAKGVGVLWEDDTTSGTLTVEMRELDVIVRQSFKRGEIERDSKDSIVQSNSRFRELCRQLSVHINLIVASMPIYTETLLQLWPDEALPDIPFQLEANKHIGEGSLEELQNLADEQDLKEVPSEVTDSRQREIYRSTIQPKPEITFDMIGGLDEEKKTIQRLVKRAVHPERYTAAGISPKATGLLVGPPGCGKTMLAEAAAHEMNGTFLSVKVSDIESMWAGEAEKNIDALFGLIGVLAPNRPLVVLIDELEGIAGSRNGGNMMNWERKITTQLLGALNKNYAHCLILAATNDGEHVDPAITRTGRFSEIITVLPPDDNGRRSIFSKWVEYFSDAASMKVFKKLDIEILVAASEGLTGSDIATIIENTLADAVEDSIDHNHKLNPVDTGALLQAIKQVRDANILRQQSYL